MRPWLALGAAPPAAAPAPAPPPPALVLKPTPAQKAVLGPPCIVLAEGVVDARDRRFAELRVWADRDGNRATGPGELRFSAKGTRALVSLSLEYKVRAPCDCCGICEVKRATFMWSDERGGLRGGAVIDVHLLVR